MKVSEKGGVFSLVYGAAFYEERLPGQPGGVAVFNVRLAEEPCGVAICTAR